MEKVISGGGGEGDSVYDNVMGDISLLSLVAAWWWWRRRLSYGDVMGTPLDGEVNWVASHSPLRTIIII